jgi:glycosyltransferase involved in cell wall biosynthesis
MYTAYPKISIITPSFNQGQFIEQTIQSVLSQNYPNLEYIVIDAASTDGTIEILSRYHDDLLWISEKDRGQSHALNKGLGMTSGEIIGFLNADDLYEPGALWAVGEYFMCHSDSAWLTGKCRIIDQDGHDVRRLISLYKYTWLCLGISPALFLLNYLSQPATFWTREIVDRVGSFDETLCYTLDYDYWMRLHQICELNFLDRRLACFRIHPASKSGSTTCAQFEEQFKVVQRYTDSSLVLNLHAFHNQIAIAAYQRMRNPWKVPRVFSFLEYLSGIQKPF